ncbi:tyrosine-type recombinase/integrase [Stenotrophomonas maltophilia]|uniref:tyrosine-type recombinase/integrase n=1 Tax=Stenotrophomonas maltophilia TaxID=40324 RepID=UPI00209A9780|nr:site-specific integrase [Stenotrophomonas maltophilia]MCO7473074.1 site-specific integrase [Stenotrophomonas maltophilia]
MARPKKAVRPKGVYDRGSAWQVKIKRKDAAGNLHTINRTFPYSEATRAKAQAQAEAFASAERAALHEEKQPASSLLGNQTLGAWIDRYILEVCPLKKGGDGDARLLRLVKERFPATCSKPVGKLQPQDFDLSDGGMAHSLQEDYELAPATIIRNLAMLSSVFTTAARRWRFKIDNPVRGALKPSVSNERERVVSDKEWTAILASLAPMRPATRAAIAFLRWTGARRGEATKLRWENVSFDKRTPEASFRDTKNTQGGKAINRTIFLSTEAVSVLNNLTKELHAAKLLKEGLPPSPKKPPVRPSSGYVFSLNEGKTSIAADSLTQAWGRACEAAKVSGATLHDLRHTRITELSNLLPVHQVMKISGHKTTQMLTRYYNPDMQDLGEIFEVTKAAAEKAQRDYMKRSSRKKVV